MLQFFKLIFAANVILAIISFFVLPSSVAMHFGAGGDPNSWCLKHTYILILFAIEVPLFLLMYFTPVLILKSPPNLLNLPNKTFWLKEENHSQLKEKTDSLMSEFGAALFTFLFVIKLITLEANRSEPVRLNERVFLYALILFLLYAVIWSVRFFKSFKIPEDHTIPRTPE
jgi:uncharacterized membrane protein